MLGNNLSGKRIWRRDTCTWITDLLCYMSETNAPPLINYTPIWNKKFQKKVRGELPKSDRTLAAYPNSIHLVSLSPKPLFCLKPSVLLWLSRSLPSVGSAALFCSLTRLSIVLFLTFFFGIPHVDWGRAHCYSHLLYSLTVLKKIHCEAEAPENLLKCRFESS